MYNETPERKVGDDTPVNIEDVELSEYVDPNFEDVHSYKNDI